MKNGDIVSVLFGSKTLGLRKGQQLKVMRIVGNPNAATTVLFEMIPQGRIRQLCNRRGPDRIECETRPLWFHNGDPTMKVLVGGKS